MGGFSNAVIGGASKLIRVAMQSPNFVTGLTGWSVNKDGSAEFQNVRIRGNVSGSTITIPDGAGSGTARIVIDNTGLHAIASSDLEILTIHPDNLTALLVQQIHALTGPGSLAGIQLGTSLSLNGDNTFTQMCTTQIDNNGITISKNVLGRAWMSFGAGLLGSYYQEEFDLTTAQVATTGVQLALSGLTKVHANTDYATAMNLATGVWTCPETGYYSGILFAGFTAFVAGSRLLLRITNGTTGRDIAFTETTPGSATTTVNTLAFSRKFLTAGDTLTFNVTQTSGANRTVQTAGADQGFIAIGREL